MENDDNTKERPQSDLSRREMLKGAVAGVAAAGLSVADPTSAAAQEKNAPAQPVNPYGGGPSTGLQFPPYYQPTPSVRSRMNSTSGLKNTDCTTTYESLCSQLGKANQQLC